MQNFPDPTFVTANGVRYALYEREGDPSRKRPPIFLIHGWPEIAYSWKNQMAPLATAGWRVIAVDMKGFGASDAPAEKGAYSLSAINADMAAIADALDIDRAIWCGHDWGGMFVWGMGQAYPERTAGVIGICTPLRPRPPAPPIEIMKGLFTDKHYFVQFQEEKWPEELFASDIEKFFALVFQKPAPRENWPALIPGAFDIPGRFRRAEKDALGPPEIADDDLAVYIDAYRRSGFHGGINVYRNIDQNWREREGKPQEVTAPSLWIGAALDMFLPVEGADGMEALVPDLEKQIIEDCGHWVTWEKPDALNAILIDWLGRRFVSS